MKTKEWIVVVVAIIVIAVIVSLITSSITGNVINVAKYGGYATTYTKAEIDAKLGSTITYQNLSKFFDSCNVYSYNGEYNPALISGTKLCSIYWPGSICINAEMFFNANSDWVTDTIGCSYSTTSNWLKVLCCSPYTSTSTNSSSGGGSGGGSNPSSSSGGGGTNTSTR